MKSMLFITNFHFTKNGNGGQQRTYFLIRELARNINLIVLSPFSGNQFPEIKAHFIVNQSIDFQKRLKKNIISRQFLKVLNLLFFKEKNKKSTHQSNFGSYILRRQVQQIKQNNIHINLNTVVFDSLNTLISLDKGLFKERILNAHNFDSELVQYKIEELSKDSATNPVEINKVKKYLSQLQKFEHHLDTYFTQVWTCSKADELKFRKYNSSTKVAFYEIPNGADTDLKLVQPFLNQYQKLLFVGSLNYKANINGLKWFVDNIFKQLPGSFELTIVGKSPDLNQFEFLNGIPNIHFIGEVEDVEPYYAAHDTVIVPLLEGSGTRLKVLEAFAYGKLVLSTAKGIEGIAAIDKLHYLAFKDLTTFKQIFEARINELELLESLRKNARALAESKYSWKGVVNNYFIQLDEK